MSARSRVASPWSACPRARSIRAPARRSATITPTGQRIPTTRCAAPPNRAICAARGGPSPALRRAMGPPCCPVSLFAEACAVPGGVILATRRIQHLDGGTPHARGFGADIERRKIGLDRAFVLAHHTLEIGQHGPALPMV